MVFMFLQLPGALIIAWVLIQEDVGVVSSFESLLWGATSERT